MYMDIMDRVSEEIKKNHVKMKVLMKDYYFNKDDLNTAEINRHSEDEQMRIRIILNGIRAEMESLDLTIQGLNLLMASYIGKRNKIF